MFKAACVLLRAKIGDDVMSTATTTMLGAKRELGSEFLWDASLTTAGSRSEEAECSSTNSAPTVYSSDLLEEVVFYEVREQKRRGTALD